MSTREGANELLRIRGEVERAHVEAIERGIEVIRKRADKGTPFSANDIRQQLLDVGVPRTAMGALFGKARALGIIRKLDGAEVKSSDTGTHNKPIAQYIATTVKPPLREDVITVPVKRDPAGRFATPAARTRMEPSDPMFEVG